LAINHTALLTSRRHVLNPRTRRLPDWSGSPARWPLLTPSGYRRWDTRRGRPFRDWFVASQRIQRRL